MANNLVFTILGIDKGSEAFDKVAKSADDAKVKLDGFGKVGTAALAAMPLAAAASGLAIAGSFALVSTALIGAAAAMVYSNQDVNDSWSALGTDISTTSHEAAQAMRGPMVESANQLRTTFQNLKPAVYDLFSSLSTSDALPSLTRGIDGLARNAMPGLLTAVKAGGPIFQGLESLMKDTGKGVSDFFTNASKGAQSSGQIFATTGTIVKDFSGFAGSLFAQLANAGGPAFASLAGALRQLEGTVLSLGQGAFPVLSNAASGFLTAGGGILRLLQLVAPVLGPLTAQALSFGAALKVVDTVSFGAVSTGLGAVKTAISDAEGIGGKFKAGVGSLANSGLPLLGLAAGALSFVLQGLGKAQRDAAEAAALHSKYVQDLGKSLDATTGKVTAATKVDVANKVAKEKVGDASVTLAEAGTKLGISTGRITDAVLNQTGELSSLDSNLRGLVRSNVLTAGSQDDLQKLMARTGTTLSDLTTIYMGGAGGVDEFQKKLAAADATSHDGSTTFQTLGQKMQGTTLDARNLWGGVSVLASGLDGAEKNALAAAQGVQALTPAQKAAQIEAGHLAADFTILSDSMKSVSEKGQAVLDALDRLQGKEPGVRETTQAWDDLMRSLAKEGPWESANAKTQAAGKGLVDLRGEVNTTTEAGSKLQDWAQQSASDFANQAAAMAAAGVPADQMSAKLGSMRDQFIKVAEHMGLTQGAAARLADTYHLVPNDVTTMVLTPNMAQKMAELGILKYTIQTLPDGSHRDHR
jgi:hypothetical protein